MSETSHPLHPERRSRIGWIVIAIVILGVVAGATFIYMAAERALQAERNLHAALYCINLTKSFVGEKGRWPASWAELESTPFPDQFQGKDWPAVSPELKQIVTIDFGLEPQAVIQQDPAAFTAIKPIGPYYEYRNYGQVQLLQQALEEALSMESPLEQH